MAVNVCLTCGAENQLTAPSCSACKAVLPLRRTRVPSEKTELFDAAALRASVAAAAAAAKPSAPLPSAPLASVPPPSAPTPSVTPPVSAPVKALAWLHCEPLPPVPLFEGAQLTVGREPGCKIVLPHKSVSRVHCAIAVRGGAIVLENRSDSNGTFINGKRANSQTLKIGDSISVGPYFLEVWAVDKLPADDSGRTRPFQIEEGDVELRGKVAAGLLLEVVRKLEANRKTGILSITDAERRAQIVFRGGKIVAAEFPPLMNEAAVRAIVAQSFGDFSFALRESDVAPTIDATIDQILSGGAPPKA